METIISITKGQIKALESFILFSKIEEETKKLCITLIEESKKLTKPVYLIDPEGTAYKQISKLEPTFLNQLMRMIGTNFRFHHYGENIILLSPKLYDTASKISERKIGSVELITTTLQAS
jgi:hypothetical protein